MRATKALRVVEVSPDLDVNGNTCLLAANLLAELLAAIAAHRVG